MIELGAAYPQPFGQRLQVLVAVGRQQAVAQRKVQRCQRGKRRITNAPLATPEIKVKGGRAALMHQKLGHIKADTTGANDRHASRATRKRRPATNPAICAGSRPASSQPSRTMV